MGSESDWSIIADNSTTSLSVSEQANKARLLIQIFGSVYWPDPSSNSGHWVMVEEKVIQSSKPLGTIDMTVPLADANFANPFTGQIQDWKLFYGDGEGAVRIDYDINVDTLSDIIDRVNSSSANINLFYDPVSGNFIARAKESGAIGITMHESPTWDTFLHLALM